MKRNCLDDIWGETQLTSKISPWVDVAKVEQLKELWAARAPVRAIAMGLGVTRNAAIGKAHRLGLPRHPNAKRPKPQRSAGAVMQATKARVIRQKERPSLLAMECGAKFGFGGPIGGEKKKPIPLPKDGTVPPNATGCSLFELENSSCRWPFDEPGNGFFFCGVPEADFAGGTPYCPVHSRAAYRSTYRQPAHEQDEILAA